MLQACVVLVVCNCFSSPTAGAGHLEITLRKTNMCYRPSVGQQDMSGRSQQLIYQKENLQPCGPVTEWSQLCVLHANILRLSCSACL